MYLGLCLDMIQMAMTLPKPPAPFSLTKLPINIPNEIKNIEIIRDTNIVGIILMLNSSPMIIAAKKNKTIWINTIGNNDSIYPKI